MCVWWGVALFVWLVRYRKRERLIRRRNTAFPINLTHHFPFFFFLTLSFFFYFLASPRSTWGLRPQARDQIHTPCSWRQICNHRVPLHQFRFLKYFDHWVSWRPLPHCLASKPVFRDDLLMIWGNHKTVSNLTFTPIYNQRHLLKPGQNFSTVRKIISRRLQLKAVCWNWCHPPTPPHYHQAGREG